MAAHSCAGARPRTGALLLGCFLVLAPCLGAGLAGGCGGGGGGGGADVPGATADVPAGADVPGAAPDTGGEPAGEPVPLGDGHMLYNVALDFVAYGEQGAALDAAGRAALWDSLLESRWPDFFDGAIYRGLTGAERATWKADVIAQFWSDVAPRLDELRTLAETTPQLVLDGRAAFLEAFPDFAPACDYFLTVAFSFQGKVMEVAGTNVFALGLEAFEPDAPELAITIAHEQFHLHHFQGFSAQGGLYRGIWAEGMASYVSALIVPGFRFSQYLGFTGERMNEIWDAFPQLVADVLENLSSSDQAVKRAYLGVEDNELGIPPGAGYYIGFLLVEALAAEHTIAELAGWDADTVYRTMEDTLPTLERP